MNPQRVAEMRRQLIAFAARKPAALPLILPAVLAAKIASPHAVVLPYKLVTRRPARVRAALKMPHERRAVAASR